MTATIKTTNLQHESAATANITLTSGGNTGIGTSGPGDRLHVYENSAYVGIKLQNQTSFLTLQMNDGIGAGNAVIYKDGAYDTAFYNNGLETMRVTNGGTLKFNSGYGSIATAYGCRAWVQYNGTNGTVNGSGNVSSVTDNGTGDFTVNFTTAMPDANYSWAIGYSSNPGAAQRNRGFFELENISTGSSRIYQIDSTGAAWDMTTTTFQVFR